MRTGYVAGLCRYQSIRQLFGVTGIALECLLGIRDAEIVYLRSRGIPLRLAWQMAVPEFYAAKSV